MADSPVPVPIITGHDINARVVTRIEPARGWLRLDLHELWEFRELLYFLIWRDIKVRYKQTVIGISWAVIQPLFTMLVFALFFGRLAKMPSNSMPYPLFYFTALLPWMYFANALVGVTNSVVENQRMITKVYFPKILLPMGAVLSGLVDMAIGFALLAAMLTYYGIAPTASVLLLPLFALMATMTALAAGIWLSALNALYRDVRYAVPFLVQFWLFASPVVYPSTLVPAEWRWLYGLNPMAGVIEGFRWSITGKGEAPGVLFLASSASVLVMLLGGLLYFQRIESKIADVV